MNRCEGKEFVISAADYNLTRDFIELVNLRYNKSYDPGKFKIPNLWEEDNLTLLQVENIVLLVMVILIVIPLVYNFWAYAYKQRRFCQFHIASFYIICFFLVISYLAWESCSFIQNHNL